MNSPSNAVQLRSSDTGTVNWMWHLSNHVLREPYKQKRSRLTPVGLLPNLVKEVSSNVYDQHPMLTEQYYSPTLYVFRFAAQGVYAKLDPFLFWYVSAFGSKSKITHYLHQICPSTNNSSRTMGLISIKTGVVDLQQPIARQHRRATPTNIHVTNGIW